MHIPKLIKSTAIYGLGAALGKAVSLFTIPFLTFHLVPEEFGVIGILLMLGALLTPIFSLGLGTSIGMTYFDPSNESIDKDKILWTAFLLLVMSSLALIAAAWMGKGPLNRFFFQGKDYETTIFLALTAASLSIPMQVWQLGLQFRNQALSHMIASLITAVVSAGLILFFVIVLGRSVSGYFEASLIGQFFGLIWFIFVGARNCNFGYSSGVARKMIAYGIPMIASFFFLFVIQNGVRYPLEHFAELSAVGIYMIGASFGLIISIVTNAFSTAWTPYALSFSEKQEEAKSVLPTVTQAYMFFGGGLVLLFFYFSRPIVLVLTASEFHTAYSVVGLSAATQYLTTLFALLLPPLYFGKKVYLVTYVQAIAALVAAVLYIILIPVWGVVGAALAVLLAHFFMVLFQLIVIRRDKKLLQLPYELLTHAKLMSVLAILAGLSFLSPSKEVLGSFIFAILGYSISIIILGYTFREELGPMARAVMRTAKAET